MAEPGVERRRWAFARTAQPTSAATRERFLTPTIALAFVLFALFSLTFVKVEIHDDGVYYYYFLRGLFGADVVAQAYQFGSAFWTAPFYLVSQLVATIGDLDHSYAGQVATAVASNVAAIVVLYLGWRILRELDLPRGAAVLFLTLLGTPLYYYVVMEPGLKHAADTLYMTAAFWFLLLAYKNPRQRYLVAAGVFLGLMLTTRYANVLIPAGVIVMFGAHRAWRTLWWVLTATAVTGALLYAIPVARDIPFTRNPHIIPTEALQRDAPVFLGQTESVRLAASSDDGLARALPGSQNIDIDLLVPAKMLFTLHRGLFIWTPLTAFATVGFLLLIRRDDRHRWFLIGLGISALGLLGIHVLWADNWDGGSGFSARFLTALFPLYLIGAAEFVRRLRWAGVAILTVCAVWSVWIGLVIFNGIRNQSAATSIVDIVQNYTGPHHDPPPHDHFGNFKREIGDRIEDRWTVYRDLVR
jgi:hypothetical protein